MTNWKSMSFGQRRNLRYRRGQEKGREAALRYLKLLRARTVLMTDEEEYGFLSALSITFGDNFWAPEAEPRSRFRQKKVFVRIRELLSRFKSRS